MREVRFIVPGEPVPKGRPKFGNGRAYTPQETRDYAEWVQWHARMAMRGLEPLSGPLALKFVAVHAIPARWSIKRRNAAIEMPEFKSTKPDMDNIEKAICDACNGIAYGDDGQIAMLEECMKVWGDDPRTEVRLRELMR